MNDSTEISDGRGGDGATGAPRTAPYAPPRLLVLGTLAELTAGGTVSDQPDAHGFAGGSGVIP